MAILFCALVYFISGKAGFALSDKSDFAALIWPTAGISIILLLFFGIRVWLGIYIGAVLSVLPDLNEFFSNPLTAFNYQHLLFILAGAALQPVVAVWMVRKLNLYPHDFSDPKKWVNFILLPALCVALLVRR